MKKAVGALLCGLLAGLWIGARVQADILIGASPATDYHPDAVTYTNGRPVPIPESLETEDTAILRVFNEAFTRELERYDNRNSDENFRVYRTGILHIRNPRLIFQEVGEPAFYADSQNLNKEDSARIFLIRLSEVREKMLADFSSGKSRGDGIADFRDMMKNFVIPYAEKEAKKFGSEIRQ